MSLWAIGSLALQAAGAAARANAAYTDAHAKKNTLKLQASTDINNAVLAEFMAQDAIDRGQQARHKYRRDMAQVKSSARASSAARGVQITSGSPLDVLAGLDVIEEADDTTLEQNAQREAFGHDVNALNYRSNAALRRFGATNTSPGMAATGSLLGSASQIASNGYSMYSTGAFG